MRRSKHSAIAANLGTLHVSDGSREESVHHDLTVQMIHIRDCG
jgi:hypothetical protein